MMKKKIYYISKKMKMTGMNYIFNQIYISFFFFSIPLTLSKIYNFLKIYILKKQKWKKN